MDGPIRSIHQSYSSYGHASPNEQHKEASRPIVYGDLDQLESKVVGNDEDDATHLIAGLGFLDVKQLGDRCGVLYEQRSRVDS